MCCWEFGLYLEGLGALSIFKSREDVTCLSEGHSGWVCVVRAQMAWTRAVALGRWGLRALER